MEVRPLLSTALTGAELLRWYWTLAELTGLARQMGVPARGGKAAVTARLAAALDAVAAADGLIAVTPVFAGSYSGLFKSFFDLIDKDSLTGKPVLLGATGGTARHSLVTEHALRPLFTYLRALVLPTAVYAASEDWGEEGLAQRIARAGAELARFTTPAAVPGQGTAPDVDTAAAIAPRSLTGAITSVDPADGFVTVPFEQRLAALRVP